MTIGEALHETRERLRAGGIEEAALEAELLLRHALGLGREALYSRLRDPLPPGTQPAFDSLIERRLAHEPTAYITGHKEFYGLELECTPDALIPRPETELLVELAVDWVKGQGSGVKVVDVGTGNGAIAVAIAVHAPAARVVGIDPSRRALRLARRNAERHGAAGPARPVGGRAAFVQGELLAPLRGRADVIVANLPYIPTRLYEKLLPEIREREPEAALHAGRRGTALIEALLAQAPALLRPGGLLLAEHAWNQGRRLREAARAAFPDAAIETRRDLAGQERVLVVENA